MSSISDELQVFANTYYPKGHREAYDALFDIANRIDSEMVELPKSADGKIWTGRETCFWTGATQDDYHIFDNICLSHGKWSIEDCHWQRYPTASVWYSRPDSLERIAAELEGLSVDSSDNYYVSRRASELAERIRKLAEKEEDER